MLTEKQYKNLKRWIRIRSVKCKETADVCADPTRAAKLEGLSQGFEEIYKALLLGPDFIDTLLAEDEK